jgi:hypothetical protein
VVLALCVIPVVYVAWRGLVLLADIQPFEMKVAQYTPKDVVGNLGGMKVVIPRHYAEFVEYDEDPPAFSGGRKGPTPERTFDSRLRSFGMDVRFPDMKGLENDQIREEKRRQPIQKRMWLYVGIITGERYPGDGFLDRLASRVYKPGDYWWDSYERLPDDTHGLEMHVAAGLDPSTGKARRESKDIDVKDIYIHRNASGKVDTYIDCRIVSCDMSFSLEPEAHVDVIVDFRRALLPEWQKIRASVRDLLLSFKVKEVPAGAIESVSQ